ncbi:MAG: PD-(D/E)XK nuclease family protein [Clostridia bacterium]|nr:PD-(D/E)XK nuclease family protein [Clostridia bacterium]
MSQSQKIEAVFFTKAINSNCVEVLSVATGIEPVFVPIKGFSCLSGGEEELKLQFNELLSRQELEKKSKELNMSKLRDNIAWLDKKEFSELKNSTSDKNDFNQKYQELASIAENLDVKIRKAEKEKRSELAKLQKAIARRAEHLYQLYYIMENDVRYGGIRVDRLFKENTSEQYGLAIFLTYKAKEIKKPNKKVYLVTDNSSIPDVADGKDEYVIIKRGRLATTKLATYFKSNGKITKTGETVVDENGQKKRVEFSEKEKEKIKEEEKKNFECLKQLAASPIFKNGQDVKKYEPFEATSDGFTFLTLIKKEYDELVFSNMFQFFFSHDDYRQLFIDFISKYTEGKITLSEDFVIGREINNIDLLITDSNNVVVIENKVKSAINGLKYDENGKLIENQLDKYRKYVEETYESKNKFFFVFLPDYSIISSSELKEYTPVCYSQLFDWFKKGMSENPNSWSEIYYKDFVQALKKHSASTDNPHEEIMRRRLQDRIEQAKDKGKKSKT